MAPEGYPLEPIDDQLRLDGAAKAMQKNLQTPSTRERTTKYSLVIRYSQRRPSVELGADLMIIASHGRSGLTRLLLGSVAERILKAGEVSRAGHEDSMIRGIEAGP